MSFAATDDRPTPSPSTATGSAPSYDAAPPAPATDTPPDELDLIARYQRGEQAAGWKLVQLHRRMIEAIARQYTRRALERADLLQVAMVGFLKGVHRFEVKKSRAGRLAPYARWWIRAEVAAYAYEARRIIGVSRYVEQALAFIATHGPDNPKSREYLRSPSIQDALLVEERVLSLDGPAIESWEGSGDEKVHPLEAHLACDQPDPEARALHAEDAAALHAAMQGLSEREQTILHLRWMTDAPVPIEEVGAALGMTEAQVRAAQARALHRLGEALKRTGHAPLPPRRGSRWQDR